MKTKLQNFNMPVDLIEKIEKLAEGKNKTAIVIGLLKQSISMRSVDEQTRDYMYEGSKKSPSFDFSSKSIRNIVDGLHI